MTWLFTRPSRDDRLHRPKADVKACIAAIDALKDDPVTEGFEVKLDDGDRFHYSETEIRFAGVVVAVRHEWLMGESETMTPDGLALGDKLIRLMQAIIDRHEAIEAEKRLVAHERAMEALAAAHAALAARQEKGS